METQKIDNNSTFGQNGNYLLGYRLVLPSAFSLGEEDFDELNAIWAKALRDLPDGTIFIQQDLFTEEKFDTSEFPSSNFIERSNKEYFNNRDFINHTCNLFFLKTNESINFNKLKNPFRPPNKKIFEEFDEKLNSFLPAVNQCITFLSNVRLKANNRLFIEPLQQDYLDKYYSYIFSGLNTDFTAEIKVDWEHLRVGNKYSALLKFPRETEFPESFKTCIKDGEKSNDNFTFFKTYGGNFSFDLPFSHIYNQIAFIDSKEIHHNNLKKSNRGFRNWRKFDPANLDMYDKTNELLKDIAENGTHQRFIRGYNNIIVFADNLEELERRVNLTSERFKTIDIVPQRAYGNNLIAQYEYSYPLNASMFLDEHVYISTTEIFSSFLLTTGRIKSDNTGVYFTSPLDNTPVKVDLWDARKKYMKSRSGLIITKTGGGKSFLINHITAYALSNGYRNVIVDLGGSYRKLAALFPDDIAYISYTEGESLGINPFELGKDELVTIEKKEELIDFIEIHWKRTEGNLNEPEKASLRRILDLYYKNFSKGHSLPHFVNSFIAERKDILKNLEIQKEFFNDDEFVLMMSEFINDGAYGFLYDDTKTNNNYGADLYNKKLVVFELDKIRSNQLLVGLMLKVINSTINKVIWRDKSTKGYVFLEEFAELLKWDGMLRQAEWFYQAIRKQEGSLLTVLQSINQFPDNSTSQSIIDNCEVLFVLEGANYKAIKERFDLPTHALYQMESMESKHTDPKNPHSEIWMKRGKNFGVFRLEAPKPVYWAYQTEGLLNTILMKIYDREDNKLEKAIDIMIQHEEYFKLWAEGKDEDDAENIGDHVITKLVNNRIYN